MEYGILIGVIALLTLMALYGYVRGFIRVVLSMVASIITIVLAAILTLPISGIIKDTSIGENIYSSVQDIVEEADVIDVETIKNLDFPSAILNPIADGANEAQETIQVYVADALTDTIIKAVTFLILVVVIYIIIRIVMKVLDIFAKLPIIHGINKWAGAAVGLVQGLIFLWIGCLVLAAFSDKAWAQEVFRQINDNDLLSFIYNNNVIIWLVAKVM